MDAITGRVGTKHILRNAAPGASSAAPVDRVEIGTQPEEISMKQVQRLVFGRPLDVGVNWKKRIEDDPARHPSQEQPAYSLLGAPDGTLVVNGTRGTYGYRPDGEVAWTLPTGYCPSPPVLAKDGTLFVNSRPDLSRPDDETKLTVARADGSVLWQREQQKDSTPWYAPVTGGDGRLYASAGGAVVVTEADGSKVTTHKMEGLGPHRPIALADVRLLLHVNGGVGLFSPGNPPTQEKVFKFNEEWPVKVTDDGTSYFWDGKTLRCVEPDFETERWKYDYPADAKGHFPVLTFASDGSIYALRDDMMAGTEVTALKPNGEFRWSWRPQGDSRWMGTTPTLSSHILVGDDGMTYYSGNDLVYAVDGDGHQKWQQRYPQTCNELSLGPNGTLVASDPSTSLRIISRKDGAVEFESSFTLGHGYPSTTVVGDTVYTATKDCQLVSVRCADALKNPPAPGKDVPPPTIEREPEYIVVAGVRVPVRRD